MPPPNPYAGLSPNESVYPLTPQYMAALGTVNRSPYAPNPPGYTQPQDSSGGGKGKKDPASANSDPGALAEFLIGKIPQLTYGEINNPSPDLVRQLSQAISGMSPSDAEDVLKALPANSPLVKAVQGATSPASSQQLYGFDPLSMANIFSQSFAPYIRQNQQMLQGDIANYGKQLQGALQGASPQYKQAYAVSAPAMQQALSMQNEAASNAIATAPEMDALLQNLAQATNSAKAAQQYASIAPYYSSLIQGQGGLIGGSGGIGGTPAASSAMASMVTPFTYGSPNTSGLQALQAQQALQALAMNAGGR